MERGLSSVVAWYAPVSSAIILAFAVLIIKEKENWVHKFNITQLASRDNLPVNNSLQTKAIRQAMLEKVRLSRGLSVDEFKDMDQTRVMALVKDPELRELIQNESAVWESQKISAVSEKIRRYGK